MTRPTWEQRISRARELGEVYASAAEVLAFYAAVASFQRDLYTYIRSARGNARFPGPSFRERLEQVLVLPRFPVFLSLIRQVAPEPLAAVAARFAPAGQPRWEKLLRNGWTRTAEVGAAACVGGSPSLPARPAPRTSEREDGQPLSRPGLARQGEEVPEAVAEAFIVRAFLQPHAEYVAEQCPPAKPVINTATCPACGSEPVVAVLREESLGARRSFVCGLCSYEWDFPRALCPACGEDRAEHLCVYTAEQFEHVRVDACDTCRAYIKTVDLTKNGLAIPVVDELATLPLTLWAQDNGYTKLQPNLIAV